MTLTPVPCDIDFEPLRRQMQTYLDADILPCVATVTMSGTDVLDYSCLGVMDLDSREPLRSDAILRLFSNTKIVTSVALMMLVERGLCRLDDPLEKYIASFAGQRVLLADATTADQTEPVASPITIRQILSHSSGLSYGFIDPFSLIDSTYLANGLNVLAHVDDTLEQLAERLSALPLAFQPGTSWRYSLATDVAARLVEIVSGQRFDDFLRTEIFSPLGMVDTDFFVPVEKHDRVVTIYAPADMFNPMTPGMTQFTKHRTAPSSPPGFLSGGGGLYSTVADYVTFMRMLINGGEWQGIRLLRPETVDLMRTNQLPTGVSVQFPMWDMPGTVFGLGLALKETVAGDEPVDQLGEYHWGGMAGTHSWMSPSGQAGFCLTQVMPSFWHPFSHDFKQFVYDKVTT